MCKCSDLHMRAVMLHWQGYLSVCFRQQILRTWREREGDVGAHRDHIPVPPHGSTPIPALEEQHIDIVFVRGLAQRTSGRHGMGGESGCGDRAQDHRGYQSTCIRARNNPWRFLHRCWAQHNPRLRCCGERQEGDRALVPRGTVTVSAPHYPLGLRIELGFEAKALLLHAKGIVRQG